MPFLDWNQDFALGVDALDTHRIVYIEILNELYVTVMKSQTQTEAGPLLLRLKEETREYHSAEEKLLEGVHYARLAQHCEQHREFTGKVSEFESRHARGDHSACIQIPRFMIEWFYKHMLKEDQLYRRCLTALPSEPETPCLETGNSRP